MQSARAPIEVRNRLVDAKSSAVVDIVAPRILTKPEMEMYVAQALQKLRADEWPKAGDVLKVRAMNEDDAEIELTEYESRWLR